jgi:glycosyltransferase involved in cell wall biosynthesis
VFKPCVVIPVYDHEHAIARVVASLRADGLPIILVDDGSHEACARELERLSDADPQITLQRHAQNQGKGAAVMAGLRAAFAAGYTHALQIDADGQHTLTDAVCFIDAARAEPNLLVCGRPLFDDSIPAVRFYGRYLTHILVWLETLSFDIPDSMCGMRLYPLAPVVALIDNKKVGSRMDFDTEVLVHLHWRNVPMRWLGTRVLYPLDGVSHFRMYSDNLLMIALHARLLIGMVIRSPRLLWRKISRHIDQQRVTQ